MKSITSILSIVLLSFLSVSAQTDLGTEVQVYPTGVIPGISVDHSISEKAIIYARIGMNLFDHRDLGVQEDEKGNGYGFSLGFKSYFNKEMKAWRWGLKNDIWRNTVEWETGNNTGESEITVIQPTAELSYVFEKNGLVFSPSFAFGIEWNVSTEGEPTGEGAIILLGAQVSKRF